jgi:hypothetical protein
MTTDDQWVKEAIASQEEHIKRQKSCQSVIGKAHSFRPHGNPKSKSAWSECIVCGVTETVDDYATKTQARGVRSC